MLKVPSLPLPSGVPALLQLFEGPLAEVQFPDIDRASLTALAEHAVIAADALCRARAALVDAQAALGEAETAVVASEGTLVAKAQRALAYARVFAAGNAELTGALAAIELDGSASFLASASVGPAAPAPKRRGRPKSSASASAARDSKGEAPDLFVVPSVAGAADEAERDVAAAS